MFEYLHLSLWWLVAWLAVVGAVDLLFIRWNEGHWRAAHTTDGRRPYGGVRRGRPRVEVRIRRDRCHDQPPSRPAARGPPDPGAIGRPAHPGGASPVTPGQLRPLPPHHERFVKERPGPLPMPAEDRRPGRWSANAGYPRRDPGSWPPSHHGCAISPKRAHHGHTTRTTAHDDRRHEIYGSPPIPEPRASTSQKLSWGQRRRELPGR
jgi:hypothetical protein